MAVTLHQPDRDCLPGRLCMLQRFFLDLVCNIHAHRLHHAKRAILLTMHHGRSTAFTLNDSALWVACTHKAMSHAHSLVAELLRAVTVTPVVFCVQEYINCGDPTLQAGCNGGQMTAGFQYSKISGSVSESVFPWKGVREACNVTTRSSVPTSSKAWINTFSTTYTEAALVTDVYAGPTVSMFYLYRWVHVAGDPI